MAVVKEKINENEIKAINYVYDQKNITELQLFENINLQFSKHMGLTLSSSSKHFFSCDPDQHSMKGYELAVICII